jgi:hypothetical protein
VSKPIVQQEWSRTDIGEAYKAQTDTVTECQENIIMFQRAITTADHLCPALEFVVLQTGSKTYGCHLLHARPANMVPPMAEILPRMAPPHDAGLFYYPQLDWLKSFSAGKRWTWAETRPDIIVGFVPNQNFYSLASSLGIFLSLFREINGPEAECPFPGTDASWTALSHDSSAEMIARETLHISLVDHALVGGEAFNVADERQASCWREKWPVICRYFGLQGVKATEDDPVEVRQYIRDHMDEWVAMEKRYDLRSGHADNLRIYPGFEKFLLTMFDTDRHFSMDKLYDVVKFQEERTTRKAWGGVFDKMRAAGIIPPKET